MTKIKNSNILQSPPKPSFSSLPNTNNIYDAVIPLPGYYVCYGQYLEVTMSTLHLQYVVHIHNVSQCGTTTGDA